MVRMATDSTSFFSPLPSNIRLNAARHISHREIKFRRIIHTIVAVMTIRPKMGLKVHFGRIASASRRGIVNRRKALNRTKERKSPWTRACNARAVPHPGHWSPVKVKSGQRGKADSSTGLTKQRKTDAPASMTKAAMPAERWFLLVSNTVNYRPQQSELSRSNQERRRCRTRVSHCLMPLALRHSRPLQSVPKPWMSTRWPGYP